MLEKFPPHLVAAGDVGILIDIVRCLKNGAFTPPEIAASIITQMTAVKYGYVIAQPRRASELVRTRREVIAAFAN